MIVLLFAASLLLTADQSCPWLDAATASGVLGDRVTSKVTSTSCEFTHLRSKLRIEVHRPATASKEFAHRRARCGSAAEPLQAIGNEAFLCSKNREIVGRVRDTLFTVRLIAPAWEARAEKVAQEVAGALF